MVLLLVVVACGRKTVPSITTEVRDSIIIKEVPRLVEVPVPGAIVTVNEFIECDSNTNKPIPKRIEANSGKARASLDVRADGSTILTGGCDSLLVLVNAMDKEIRHLHSEKTKEVRPVPVYKTRSVDIFCRWFTCIVGVLVIGLFFRKLNQLNP